jgi:DNA-binding MarR family transcriptional regulator
MSDPGESSSSGPELKTLLEQVQILANQIKKSAVAIEDAQHPLVVGRAVLEMLETSGPQTVPALAGRRNSSRQNVQIVVNRLHRFGLVEFTPNPAHRKSGLVRITEQGKAILERGAEQEAKLLDELGRQLAEFDLQPVVRLLGRLQEVLGTRQEPIGQTPGTNGRQRNSKPLPAQVPVATNQDVPTEEDYSLPYNLL